MIQSVRDWAKRNRGAFAVGAGIVGGGYVATQWVLGKFTESRQRHADERIAKENLRRRFEQNQEDCTFTVLAILPTATENIIEALPVEQALAELQAEKSARVSRSVGMSEIASTADLPSASGSTIDPAESITGNSFIHASQIAPSVTSAPTSNPMSDSQALGGSMQVVPKVSKKTKLQLWNDIKIQSIARCFTLIYTLSLLTLFTRIQLNLLGRRNYLASVVSLASPPKNPDADQKIRLQNNDDDGCETAYTNDFETNRKYLSFSWWLLHRGYADIMEKVQAAVKEVFGPVSPREDVSLEKMSELVIMVRKKIEGFTEQERRETRWLPYLLPPQHQEDYVLQSSGMLNESTPTTTSTTPFLRRLLDETADLTDSPAFTHVLTQLLDTAFSFLIDTKIASQAYKIPPISASASRITELVSPGDAKARLASTLAVFSRQAHGIGSGVNNEYLAGMENVRDLEAFAAVIYSSNFEFEAADAEGAGPSDAAATALKAPVLSIEDADAVNKHQSLSSDLESAWGRATTAG